MNEDPTRDEGIRRRTVLKTTAELAGIGVSHSVGVDPASRSLSTTHTDTDPGEHEVTVAVTDDEGATGTDSVTVGVNAAPEPTVGVEVSPRRPIGTVQCPGGDGGRTGETERGETGRREGGRTGPPPGSTDTASEGTGRCDVPVDVQGTDEFDPLTDLDVGSLRFGAPDVVEAGGGALPVHEGGHEASTTSFAGSVRTLRVHFPAEDTGITQSHGTAKLMGLTEEGLPIVGTSGLDR